MTRICPIYKSRGSKSDPDNYRPISVLSVVARLFEKLVHDQLFKHLDSYLYSNQSGFRPKYSTETSTLNITNQLFLNIDRGQYNIAVLSTYAKLLIQLIIIYRFANCGITVSEVQN